MPLVVIRQLKVYNCGPVLHRVFMEPKPEDCEPDLVEKYLSELAREDVNIFIKQFPEFRDAEFIYQYHPPHCDLIRE